MVRTVLHFLWRPWFFFWGGGGGPGLMVRVGLIIQKLRVRISDWQGLSLGGAWMSSTLSTLNTTTELPLSKAPNPKLLPGRRGINGCPVLRVCVHCCVCTFDGLIAEHKSFVHECKSLYCHFLSIYPYWLKVLTSLKKNYHKNLNSWNFHSVTIFCNIQHMTLVTFISHSVTLLQLQLYLYS